MTEDFKKQKDVVAQLTEEIRKAKADLETKEAELVQKIKFSEDEKRFLK